MPDDDRPSTHADNPARSSDLLRLDAALLDLRRLFAQPAKLALPDGGEVESSTVLVAEAVAQLSGGEPESHVQISHVAGHLHVTPSTASRLVTRAINAGAVNAAPSPSDPRAKDLTLTEEGRQLRELALRHRLGVLGRATNGWPAADRAALAELLTRLAATQP